MLASEHIPYVQRLCAYTSVATLLLHDSKSNGAALDAMRCAWCAEALRQNHAVQRILDAQLDAACERAIARVLHNETVVDVSGVLERDLRQAMSDTHERLADASAVHECDLATLVSEHNLLQHDGRAWMCADASAIKSDVCAYLRRTVNREQHPVLLVIEHAQAIRAALVLGVCTRGQLRAHGWHMQDNGVHYCTNMDEDAIMQMCADARMTRVRLADDYVRMAMDKLEMYALNSMPYLITGDQRNASVRQQQPGTGL